MAGLAVNFDVSADLLDEAIDLAQPEPGALPGVFGREERLEGAAGDIAGHADAVVGHRNFHVLTGPDLRIPRAINLIEKGVAGLDGQFAAFGHGVARVDREIKDGGFKLRLVGLDLPHAAGADDFELHLLRRATA